ncbi:beta-propeller domain-containing protein, partial [Desulfobacterales bacterium HSG17]|nr:beta-propeller domain-containing protein [Desulfobacterales bacterium HSG17]
MKKLCVLSAILFIMAIAMIGCSSSDSNNALNNINPPENNEPDDNEPDDTNPLSTASLSGFKSDGELEQYLKKGLQSNALEQVYRDDSLANEAGDAAIAPAPEDKTNSVFSKTNIQEAGVDEADTIKTDGRFLYIAPSMSQVYYMLEGDIAAVKEMDMEIADEGISKYDDSDRDEPPEPVIAPAPVMEPIIAPVPDMRPEEDFIRILELSTSPADANEVAKIPVTDFDNNIDGLYLLTEREENKPDLLVTIGGNAQDMWGIWNCPWCWTNGAAEIAIFNIDNPAAPEKISHIKLDGQLISSRRIKDKLYLVTRYTPNLPDFRPYPANSEEEVNNEMVLEKAELSDLLPNAEVNGISSDSFIKADQCFLPPLNEERTEEPDLITVSAIDLNNPDNMVSQSVAGPVETFYMSTQSLYLASTRQYYGPFMGIPEIAPAIESDTVETGTAEANSETAKPDTVNSDTYTPPPVTTDLHKFVLTENGPVYKGSGEVQGHLGWEIDKKPFRMSEHDNILRIATSLGDTWNETASTRLALFKESSNDTLEEISHIDNIGEKGENLYASRFIGTRAYLVTFRVTDPLYVFDLSDPYAPVKSGELHIQGYSDYLHPISEDLLLGIGKDAIADEASFDRWMGRQGAWYQGVKLSLFDVSNPANPYEKDSVIIGKRGTDAGALYDHHAMAYLPPANGQPARLALPIRMNDTYPDYNYFKPSDPSAWYDWTQTGLYMFEIGTSDISNAGQMIVSGPSQETPTDMMILLQTVQF